MAHSEVVNTNTSRHAIFQALIWTRHFQHFQTRTNNRKRISNFSSLFKNCGLWILPWCEWSFTMSNPKLLTANTILIFSPCTFHVQLNVSQDQITVNRWMCHRIKSQFGGSLHYHVILSLLSPWTGECVTGSNHSEQVNVSQNQITVWWHLHYYVILSLLSPWTGECVTGSNHSEQVNVSQDQITVNRWMCHRIKSQFGGSLHYYVILSLLSPWTGECVTGSNHSLVALALLRNSIVAVSVDRWMCHRIKSVYWQLALLRNFIVAVSVNRWMCHRIKSQFGGSLHYYVILSLLSPWTGECVNGSQDQNTVWWQLALLRNFIIADFMDRWMGHRIKSQCGEDMWMLQNQITVWWQPTPLRNYIVALFMDRGMCHRVKSLGGDS